ncbi:uncharacterized protein CTRU02_200546 [Colletotrichum truncatum]|uniref:Uncharacterized protein n=1 Tax=Colletotrichum truncatum TaxID=5467 RepID=A0ACC3ZF59_COLTU
MSLQFPSNHLLRKWMKILFHHSHSSSLKVSWED